MIEGGLVFLGVCMVAASFIFVSVRVFQVNPVLVKKIFKYAAVVAVGLIFSVASVIIGLRLKDRNDESFRSSFKSVVEIWGGELLQPSPSFSEKKMIEEQYTDKEDEYRIRTKQTFPSVGFSVNHADITIHSNIRTKGLLKFAGYTADFSGHYEYKNDSGAEKKIYFNFPLPDRAGNISAIKIEKNGVNYTGDADISNGIDWNGTVRQGESVSFDISYSAQGTAKFQYGKNSSDSSQYSEGTNGISVADYSTQLTTDFTDVIIGDGTMAPSENSSDSTGTKIRWKTNNTLLKQGIALEFRISENYGALFSKIFFYSPLMIFLFLSFLLIFTVSSGIRLHPMHFMFITAGFFVFYLLGSYAVSYLHVIPAIAASLLVSTAITLYYVRLLSLDKKIFKITALSLGVFQWFFTAAFFLPEHTGFLITLAAIIALVVLMKLTSKTDWEEKW